MPEFLEEIAKYDFALGDKVELRGNKSSFGEVIAFGIKSNTLYLKVRLESNHQEMFEPAKNWLSAIPF